MCVCVCVFQTKKMTVFGTYFITKNNTKKWFYELIIATENESHLKMEIEKLKKFSIKLFCMTCFTILFLTIGWSVIHFRYFKTTQDIFPNIYYSFVWSYLVFMPIASATSHYQKICFFFVCVCVFCMLG